MSDEIIGTAVLHKNDRTEFLHVICHTKSKGKDDKFECHIEVREKKDVSKAGPRCWTYEVKGNVLNVSPSLKVFNNDCTTERFHNSGQWSIPFVEFDADKYDSAMSQLRALNP